MYHRGGRGFHNNNFHRMSRKDGWEYNNGRQNNNNYVRNNRSRSATRFSQPQQNQVPQWMNGKRNHIQRRQRSSSCGPPRRFFNNQGPMQTFHNNQGPPQAFHKNQGPQQTFRNNQGPLQTFHNNQGSSRNFHHNQGSNFHSHRGPRQDPQQWNIAVPNPANVHYDGHGFDQGRAIVNDRFDQRRMIGNDDDIDDDDDDSNSYADPQMNNSSGYCRASMDSQNIQQSSQNNYVPMHQKERESHPIGVNLSPKKEPRKLWVINQTVLDFIAANIPEDQQQARSAFEQANDRVITRITTYHCKYCSIRCRTLEDLESHKKTKMHIKKRDKFVKNWSKTITDGNSVHPTPQQNFYS